MTENNRWMSTFSCSHMKNCTPSLPTTIALAHHLLSRVLPAFILLVTLNAHGETLRESLSAKGISLTGMDSPNLDKNIAGGSEFDDSDVYFSAYYLADDTRNLIGPLQVEMLNKKSGKWTYKNVEEIFFDGRGAITNINRSKNGFYVHAHINPWVVIMNILSPTLEFRGSTWGQFLGDFADASVLYVNNTIFFEPTHPGHVSIFNPNTKTYNDIYPMKPYQPIRLEHIAKVKTLYDRLGEDWLRAHRYDVDPEEFANYISEAVTSDVTNSLAFIAKFYNEEMILGEWKKESEKEKYTDVVYVYRNIGTSKKIEYKEILLDDVKEKFGDLPLADLLKPKILRRTFAQKKEWALHSPPNRRIQAK